MAKVRRIYTREFKLEAVKLVTEKGCSVVEAARSLGLHENLIRSWKRWTLCEWANSFDLLGRTD